MNNSPDILGLDEKAVESLMLEVFDYTEKLRRVFNQLEELMIRTSQYYNSECAEAVRHKFALFEDNFMVSVNNFLSYKEDLSLIKQQYILKTTNLSDIITQNPDEIKIDVPNY